MYIRTDCKTKKQYTYFNLPIEEISCKQNKNGFYIIFNEKRTHPNDAWYNGTFIGDRYAVFKWIKTGIDSGFYQQMSKWYINFGWAKRKLHEISQN